MTHQTVCLTRPLPGLPLHARPNIQRLQRASGFTPVEVFRKYLWFVLRERKFDLDAVADMVALKGALGLSDEEVAEALRERAQRIYDKYGTLMLSTEGMSAAGLQRKATCQVGGAARWVAWPVRRRSATRTGPCRIGGGGSLCMPRLRCCGCRCGLWSPQHHHGSFVATVSLVTGIQ